jgi:hypothetical protein
MHVGEIVYRRGYITELPFVRGRTAAELDRLIGYRAGRLAEGWALLHLVRMPGPDEFEFRGYSHMSGGIAAGEHRTAEGQLHQSGYDLGKLKQEIIRNKFRIAGARRLVKIVPNRTSFGAKDFPPGAGIPQWELRREMPFRVAELIPPADAAGGAGARR